MTKSMFKMTQQFEPRWVLDEDEYGEVATYGIDLFDRSQSAHTTWLSIAKLKMEWSDDASHSIDEMKNLVNMEEAIGGARWGIRTEIISRTGRGVVFVKNGVGVFGKGGGQRPDGMMYEDSVVGADEQKAQFMASASKLQIETEKLRSRGEISEERALQIKVALSSVKISLSGRPALNQ